MDHPRAVFPSLGMQVLSALVHFIGVSVLAHFLSRRLTAEDLLSWRGWTQLSWARLLIVLVFIDSWLFLFTSGIILFGTGLESNIASCTSAIFLCITFYASSKALIYLFLIEKVHVVWAPITGTKRSTSKVYLTCMLTMLGYIATIILLFIGRIAALRSDGACVIGLRKLASLPLVAYDLIINVFLTALFLWPLTRASVVNPVVKRVATRTLLASTVALVTSAVNMLILTLLHGHELGWVCLGSCGTDVIINALALFWVTGGSRGPRSQSEQTLAGRTADGGPGGPTKDFASAPAPTVSTHIRRPSVVLAAGRAPPPPPLPTLGPAKRAHVEDAGLVLSPASGSTAFDLDGEPGSVFVPTKDTALERTPASAPPDMQTFARADPPVRPVRWSVISQEARDDRAARPLNRWFALLKGGQAGGGRDLEERGERRTMEVTVTRTRETDESEKE